MDNPLVALQVQTPNIGGNFLAGMAQQQEMRTARLSNMIKANELQQQQEAQAKANQLQQFYQQNGPALIGGDQQASANALAQLAQFNPDEALKAQQSISTYKKSQADAQAAQQNQKSAQINHLVQSLSGVLRAPAEARAALYGRALEESKSLGMDPSLAPQQYDEDWVKQHLESAISIKDQMSAQERATTEAETARHNAATEGQSAAQLAETARHNKVGEAAASAKISATESGALPDDAANQMADQYIAGDKSVMQNLGRGAQGAQNIVKIRGLVAKKLAEQGRTGADMAQAMAEFSGLTSGERALGTRTANIGMAVNEAQQVAPLALQASAEVSRSKFVPITQAEQMIQRGTNDPALRRFVAANNALVNVYARAINPTGVPTESDKSHAREMLSTAFDQKSYAAVVDQMMQEMAAAQKSPAAVRQEFRRGTETSNTNTAPATSGGAGSGGADDLLRKYGVQ